MIAQSIAEQGAMIAFVAPTAEPIAREPSHPKLLRVTTPRELVGNHSRFQRAAASLSRICSGFAAVCKLRLSTKSFIFSIPDPLIFTLPLFALLRVSGARVVFIVHDSQPHAWSFGAKMRPVERSAHALSYRMASTIVVLTPSVKDALVKDFSISPDKIVVIPHGPFSIGDVGPIPDSKRILIFGSLRRNKSVLESIEAIVSLRARGFDVNLVLAGEPLPQEQGYWEQCLAVIAQDPDGFDVRAAFIADDALPELIAGVDAFLLAYHNFDSQSGVGVMAAVSGRPVIGTRSGGLSELFDRGMAGEVIRGNLSSQSIADGISAFYAQDMGLWQERASKGAALIAETLVWDDIANQYIDVCRSDRA